MDVAEYKHLVLGLSLLKYLTDAFDEYHAKLETRLDECGIIDKSGRGTIMESEKDSEVPESVG